MGWFLRRWLHGQGKVVRGLDILRVYSVMDQIKSENKQTRVRLIKENKN